VVDEKLVNDSGNHSLAYLTSYNLDLKRMEILYENAKR